MSSVGIKIVNLREKRNWTQRELARRVDLNFSVMNRIESGDRPIRDVELRKLADVLDVSSDYLLGRTDYELEKVNNEYELDEEISKLTKDLQVWYKNEPEDKEMKVEMLRRMLKSFEDDE